MRSLNDCYFDETSLSFLGVLNIRTLVIIRTTNTLSDDL